MKFNIIIIYKQLLLFNYAEETYFNLAYECPYINNELVMQ